MRIPFALVLLAIGCSAQSPTGTPMGGPGSPGPRPGPAGPGTPSTPPGGAACTTREAFASPLRRLTRGEYNNTVRDLLGDRTAPADRFPPDEVSGGFSNNAAVLGVSPLLAEKYQEAAEALAAAAVKDLPALVGCDFSGAAEQACARQFVQRFGRRAYRRPLAAADTDRLMALYQAGRAGGSFAEGIEVVLRAVLQAPAFLYRIEGRPGAPGRAGSSPLAPLDGYEVATRLSYFLWGTMPDDALLTAAERNALATADQIEAAARRMLADPRARPVAAEFHRQWLGLTALDRLAKDARAYPEFDDELRAGMRAETAAFVEAAYFGSERTLATLLASDRGFVTPALARLYGVPPPAGAQPTAVQPVALPRDQRAGLLTQAGFLAVHALPDQSSPVNRGKLVREQILCQPMPPQPPGLMVTPPEVDPRKPTRERFAQHAADPQCATCHQLMDPIGFGFERYDGLGRFRTTDGGRAVDDSGEVTAADGSGFRFQGARELGEQLAASAVVEQCLATQWYRFAFGRLEGPGDQCSLRELQAAFAGARDLGELLVALTRTEAFRHRPASTSGDTQ
jgi:Protein of unknown function (DUF1592)/Protein of unknown function (DUF1588)/Protein of unknown function (DUF1587)/Protein of unknown function (DUF1595)/Protein of unknown function (DUF1585)